MREIKIARKRLFLGLALGALFLAAGFVLGFWYLSTTNARRVINEVFVAAGWIALFLLVCGLAGIVVLAVSLFNSRSLGILRPFAFRMLNFVYPFAVSLAKVLHFDQNLVKRSYIEVHNQATRFSLQDKEIKRMMILAPHCLQKSDCPHKITIDINNCRRCGRCSINGLIHLADIFNAELAVVTGGTLAREVIVKHRSEAVVAIACERDLISGIQDVMPLTVIGVLNERPNGPCHDTTVILSEVEGALCDMLGKISHRNDEEGRFLPKAGVNCK